MEKQASYKVEIQSTQITIPQNSEPIGERWKKAVQVLGVNDLLVTKCR